MVAPVMAPQVQTNRRPDWATDDQLRLARYADARDFVDGVQWIGKARRGEKRLTFNYARSLMQKVASYVFPGPIKHSVYPRGDEALANRVEATIGELLIELSADELDYAMCVESSSIGDAACKVTWDAIEKRPQLGQVDPSTLWAWYDPTLPTRVLRISHRYLLPGATIAPALGLSPNQVEGVAPDQLYPIEEDWTATSMSITAAGQVVRTGDNPYGWIPYCIWPNERQPRHLWGRSDLTDLYDVIRELNSRMSVLSKILELSGAPIAVLENVDGSEGITVGPGAKWELPEGAKAYLLDLLQGEGVRLHIENIETLYRVLHDLAETPRTAFGDSGRNLSGAALEVEVQPLVQRVRRKRRSYDAYARERNRRVLDLIERFGGVDCGGLRLTRTEWPPILPSDEDSQVRNAVSLVSSGIQSRRRSASALGIQDPEAELQQVIAEARQFAASMPQDKSNGDQGSTERAGGADSGGSA